MLVHASSRSSFVREHLREVLKTMSCGLYPDDEFQINLIGKAPDNIREILDRPDTRRDMHAALEEFCAFIKDRG
jgi:chromate reductase, NAD(P)H dehydrogenase (quinone)